MSTTTSSKQTSFLFTTSFLAISSLISLLLGIVRDRIFTTYFTATELDPYYAAFKFPDFIFQILITGAVSASFIPVLLDVKKQHGNEEMKHLIQASFTVAGAILLGLSALIFLFAPWLVPLVTPGFDQTTIATTIALTRIMILSPLFMGLGSIICSILNAHKHFLFPSFTPIVYNLGIIAGAVFLRARFGVHSLAWGVALGSLLYMFIVLPFMFSHGFFTQFRLSIKHWALPKIGTLAIPRFFGIGATQIGFFFDTAIASLFPAGSVTAVFFALKIQNMPVNIFAINTSIVAFPTLVEYATEKNWNSYNKTLLNSIRQALFLTLPISIIFFLIPESIVKIFAAYKFTPEIISLIGLCMIMYAISIWAQSIIFTLIKAFYALQNTLTPVLLGIISIIIKILAAVVLSNLLHNVFALPLSFSISQIINTLLLIVILHKTTHFLSRAFVMLIVNLGMACASMALVLFFVKPYIGVLIDSSRLLGNLMFIGILGGIGFLVYFVAAFLLHIPEAQQIITGLQRRVRLIREQKVIQN